MAAQMNGSVSNFPSGIPFFFGGYPVAKKRHTLEANTDSDSLSQVLSDVLFPGRNQRGDKGCRPYHKPHETRHHGLKEPVLDCSNRNQ